MQHRKVGVAFFEFANFGPNLGRAIYYLFDLSGSQTNSLLVSYAGGVALLLLLAGARSVFMKATSRPGMALVFFAFLPVVIVNVAMMFFYWWGHFNDPMASRFSLPLQLFLVLSILLVLSQWRHIGRVATLAVGIAGLGIWVWTIPVNAGGYATKGYFSANEVEWQVSVVLNRFDHRTLVVSESSLPLIAHRRPAMPFALFNVAPKRFWELKTQGHYDQILVF